MSGFEDIEWTGDQGGVSLFMKRGAPSGLVRAEKTSDGRTVLVPDENAASKAEYFSLAGRYFWVSPFLSGSEKSCWEMHAEGATVAETVKKLKKPKSWVLRVLHHHRRIMLGPEDAWDDEATLDSYISLPAQEPRALSAPSIDSIQCIDGRKSSGSLSP